MRIFFSTWKQRVRLGYDRFMGGFHTDILDEDRYSQTYVGENRRS